MSLFQRIPDFATDSRSFTASFHFLDDHAHRTRPHEKHTERRDSFDLEDCNPSFDVRESVEAYEVRGLLQDADTHNLNVDISGEDILTISGNYGHQYTARIEEEKDIRQTPAAEVDEWQQQLNVTIDNIDVATSGPGAERRSSVINASQWQAPLENIDWATTFAYGGRQRRSSVIDAQVRREPLTDIDAYLRVHDVERQNRRPSITNASSWQQPAQNIDSATSGPLRKQTTSSNRSRSVSSKPADSIDAATTGSPRNSTTIIRPRSRRVSKERSNGTFSRVFQFPRPVCRGGIKASLRGGLLTVMVPKRMTSEVAKIKIPISIA